MNQDQILGRVRHVAGRLEQTLGKLLHNRKLEITGLTKQVLGSAQMVHGDIRTRIQKRKLTPF